MQGQQTVFNSVVSYASVGFADGYFKNTVTKWAFWNSLPVSDLNMPVDKDRALKEATLEMDKLFYVGHKLRISQEREWPRFLGMGTYGDIYYLETQIPLDVAKACAEQAYYTARLCLSGVQLDNRLDHIAQGVISQSRVGGAESVDFNVARKHKVCPDALNLLRPFIAKTGNLNRTWRTPVS